MTRTPKIEFESHRLKNGLCTLLHSDNRVPLVHITIHYRVGSSYEEPGRSGLAHLFEHMMFQGSENVAKNEHGRLIDEAGGSWNASTNKDRTNYFESLPAHCLELGLWLEADRMRSLAVTEENFENQRKTVIEEKKQSYDNRPYGLAFLRFDEIAYKNWAYAHSIIGEVDDLEKAQIAEAVEFHRNHYGPDNAVLVLSGDFKCAEALALVERHFGPIGHQTSITRPDLTEKPATAETEELVHDPLAPLDAVWMGYRMPPLGSADHYALSILALVLSEGESSRIYRELVYKKNWITGLSSGPNGYKGPQIFRLWFMVQKQAESDKALRAVDEELLKVMSERVADSELEKARNHFTYRYVMSQNRIASVAETLARYAIYHDDPGAANHDLDRFLSVSSSDMLEAAQRTFRAANRTVLRVAPGGVGPKVEVQQNVFVAPSSR